MHSEIWYLYLYTAFPEIAIINLTFWLDIWLKIATINACNDLWIYSRWCTPCCCARLIFYFDLNYFWGFQRYHINLVGHIKKKGGGTLWWVLAYCYFTFAQQDNKAIIYGNHYINKYISRTLLLIYLITWYLCFNW